MEKVGEGVSLSQASPPSSYTLGSLNNKRRCVFKSRGQAEYTGFRRFAITASAAAIFQIQKKTMLRPTPLSPPPSLSRFLSLSVSSFSFLRPQVKFSSLESNIKLSSGGGGTSIMRDVHNFPSNNKKSPIFLISLYCLHSTRLNEKKYIYTHTHTPTNV